MSGRISVVSNTGSSSGGTTGGGSIGPSITSGGTLSASLQGTSYKLVVDEPPDLMINLETNAYEQRMPDYSDFKMRIEDSNATLQSTVSRAFADLELDQLALKRLENIANTPFSIYLNGVNFQLVKKTVTYFPTGDSKSEKRTKEVYGNTSYRFNEKSTNFDIPTVMGQWFYVMLKEEMLIGSLKKFFDAESTSMTEDEFKKTTELALIAIRSNLINKFFVTEFLSENLYDQILHLLEKQQMFEKHSSILLSFVHIMNVLLGRSLKYKSFKYNHIVASLKPKKPSARSSIQSEEERRFSAYLEEPVHTQKDKDVFEQFKNDVTFWKNLLISLLRSPNIDPHMGTDVWSQGDAYCVFELLAKICSLDPSILDSDSIEKIFKLCGVGFERLGAGCGKLPVALNRDPSRPATEDEAKRDLLADKKLTMYLRSVKLMLKICSMRTGEPEVLQHLVSFVQKFHLTMLLYDSDLKSKLNVLYPYCVQISTKNKIAGGTDFSKSETMQTVSQQMMTKIYYYCFVHFYNRKILHLVKYQEFDRRKGAIDQKFQNRGQAWDLTPERRKMVLDFESLQEENYVREFHLDVIDHFVNNTTDNIIGKLCGQHFIPVPIVKAVFYTTEFVLKNLGLQRQKKPIEETESEDYSLMIQSELLGFDFEKVIKTERLKKSAKTEDESLKLYSYFFSGSSTPGKSDLLDFITKLLENFINTFLLGRPTDRHKHFFKVITFERSAIEHVRDLNYLKWASPNPKQAPNSKEFLQKITYEKNIELPRLREECAKEAVQIWEEQCLHYCSKNEVVCFCKYKDLAVYEKKPQVDAVISLKLSSDRQKIIYKLADGKSKQTINEKGSENSVMVKSCCFTIAVDKVARLTIDLVDHGQQQTDTTHFPILIEEKANENDAASLIFFCKALENVLVDAPQQIKRTSGTDIDKKICEKIDKRPEMVKKISDLLLQTRTFPAYCLPIERKETKGVPSMPPLPTSLPISNSADEFL